MNDESLGQKEYTRSKNHSVLAEVGPGGPNFYAIFPHFHIYICPRKPRVFREKVPNLQPRPGPHPARGSRISSSIPELQSLTCIIRLLCRIFFNKSFGSHITTHRVSFFKTSPAFFRTIRPR